MRVILPVDHAGHAGSAVPLTEKKHDQNIALAGMGLTLTTVRI